MNTLKYLVVTILIMFFVFDGAFAEEKQAPQSKDTQDALYGFQDIPFGTPYEEVKQKLEKTYNKMEHTYSSRDWDDHISFNHFDLGDDRIEIQASFRFDHNKKFYGFNFTTKAAYKNGVYTGDYLLNVFKNKYGEPNCKGEHRHQFCVWDDKDLNIFVNFFSTINVISGFVTSKKLEKEYNSYKKQQENKNAIDGAKKF